MWPTVYAIAAPTPMGAKYITMFVNLNIVSARLAGHATEPAAPVLAQEAERDPEQHAEDDDLQDVALGDRLRDVLREGVEDHLGRRLLLPP